MADRSYQNRDREPSPFEPMEIGPFGWATVYAGFLTVSSGLFAIAGSTTGTAAQGGELAATLFQVSLWLGVAAGACVLLGIVLGATRAGWGFWETQRSGTPGEGRR